MSAHDSASMSDDNGKHEKKKVTAATTDAPQEEFIAPANIPSKTQTPEAADPQGPLTKKEPNE